MAGKAARLTLNGAWLLRGDQEATIAPSVDHQAPGGETNELLKGVLSDKAHGVFLGSVMVRAGADGTNARQLNRNLLTSPTARVDTRPELTIYADEVKCGHGATVGDLDEAALFYLLSRGIDPEDRAPHADRGVRRRSAGYRRVADRYRRACPALSERVAGMNAPVAVAAFDPRALREEFPIFARNPGLVFLDTAASAQKPRAVIDGIADYYRSDYANVHRGVYRLSARSTERLPAGPSTVRRFVNAADDSEIVFVRGATEAHQSGGVLLGCHVPARRRSGGDFRDGASLQHRAMAVPARSLWVRIAGRADGWQWRARSGRVRAVVDHRASKLVAMTHVANVTGHILPVRDVVRLAHAHGAKVLLDGCQALPRIPVDVRGTRLRFLCLLRS